jgi:hypothetical protein
MTEATTDFYLANFAPFERDVAKNGQPGPSRCVRRRSPGLLSWDSPRPEVRHGSIPMLCPSPGFPSSPPTELHPM